MFRTILITIVLATSYSIQADQVDITFKGTVEWNQINSAPLGNVNAGDQVVFAFQIDSGNYVDSNSFPTRGYIIEPNSWSLTMGTTTVEIQNPFKGTPYFIVRNNDPVVDGFMLSTGSVDYPLGIQLEQDGVFGPFIIFSEVTYSGGTLSSLDILGAIGTYNYTGLSVYNFLVRDGPYEPLGIEFELLEIKVTSNDCPDINGDDIINVSDVLSVIDQWGLMKSPADVTNDGIVDVSDLLLLVGSWGPCE